jgi:solute carrier family 25 phosphate transporter 3
MLLLLLLLLCSSSPCRTYADMAGEELVAKYQTLIFLAGSASAEFFADMALSPFEAVKVR